MHHSAVCVCVCMSDIGSCDSYDNRSETLDNAFMWIYIMREEFVVEKKLKSVAIGR